MKPFRILKFPMILVGLGAALGISPACKAQEVSPDHFTDTGLQDVYNAPPAKTGAPKLHQNQPASQPRSHQAKSAATLQPGAKHTLVSPTQPGPKAVADKSKLVPSTPKKQ